MSLRTGRGVVIVRAAFEPRVLRRLVLLTAIAGLVVVAIAVVVRPTLLDDTPGDFATRQGDILLSDGDFARAIRRFDEALTENPQHRGALMGKAIALMQSGQPEAAEALFNRLIAVLSARDLSDDPTGRGTLAAAHANRGILADRTGRHEQALADYRLALAIDAEAVQGPGLVDRILYGTPRAASVEARARYLASQLQLPEEQRRLSLPEADARQRMHKP